LIVICKQSAAALSLIKPFVVLKICLRQLHHHLSVFLIFFFISFSEELLRIRNCSKFFLGFSQENLQPKSDLGIFENRAPGHLLSVAYTNEAVDKLLPQAVTLSTHHSVSACLSLNYAYI